MHTARPSRTRYSTDITRGDAHEWITNVARSEVVKRMMEDQCARNIAVGAHAAVAGGLQSDTVLRLRVDIHLIAKVAGSELRSHERYLSFVNSLVPRMFPEVFGMVALDKDKYALLMEDLVDRESALNLVFRRQTKTADLSRLLNSAYSELMRLHGTPAKQIPRWLRSIGLPDPYSPRLFKKIKATTDLDSRLACLWKRSCKVFEYDCPPLEVMLQRVGSWAHHQLVDVKPTLLHGDPHLGNIFYRTGDSSRVRFIDPNPDVGYGDPVYDFGKLLHWIEPVGWAGYDPTLCRSRIELDRKRNEMKLSAWLSPDISQAAEQRRSRVERSFYALGNFDEGTQARLALSVASAHAGLARLLAHRGSVVASRYVIAYLLRALCRWSELVY